MSNLPTVAIILQTYQRTDYALKTIQTAVANLQYGGQLAWIVADDGSCIEHFSAVCNALEEGGQKYLAYSEKLGYGGIANKAIRELAGTGCNITLWLEDDWRTERPFDITPYVELLNTDGDIGMVRLAHLPVGLALDSIGRHGRMYLHVQKSRQYCYSGNPHLKHTRFFEHYGLFPEDRNPGDTEIYYDYVVREHDGPKIVWPLAIGDTFPFGHIGEVQSY